MHEPFFSSQNCAFHSRYMLTRVSCLKRLTIHLFEVQQFIESLFKVFCHQEKTYVVLQKNAQEP